MIENKNNGKILFYLCNKLLLIPDKIYLFIYLGYIKQEFELDIDVNYSKKYIDEESK